MAARKRDRPTQTSSEDTGTPALEDEADIVQEVGAERDEDGDLMADEDRLRDVGGVDANAVIHNRRIDRLIGKKRSGKKNVRFNTGDLSVKYDALMRIWNGPDLIDIKVTRLTGSPVTHYIESRPRSGRELHEAIKTLHGQNPETKYEVKFSDRDSHEFRGSGTVTMPDTRPQQGQPMYPPPGYPPGYAPPPPGYPPPQGYPPQHPPGYPPQAAPAPQAPAAPTPQQAPPVVLQPAAPDMGSMLSGFQQLMSMMDEFRRMTQPAPSVVASPPPAAPAMPPMPPQGADMGTMMTWFRQALDIFRQMQPQTPGGSTPAQQQNPMAAMMGMMGIAPPQQTPPGMTWVPNVGFVPTEAIFRAMTGMANGGGGGGGGAAPRPGYRPGYGPRGYPSGDPGERGYSPPSPAAPAQKTALEQFAEARKTFQAATALISDMHAMFPSRDGDDEEEQRHRSPHPAPDEDSPVQIVDTGPAKLVINKEDGGIRMFDTAWANMDKVLKWVGEQRAELQRSAAERQPQRPQRRTLPEGYVEVLPGDQPPPGYQFVPVDPDELPPPPQEVPPPIERPRRQWSMPSVPEE